MQWQPTLVLALGKSHGQSHLIGCCPCVPRESTGLSDFIFTFSVSCTGKEMSTHSSILSWRIQRMKAPGRLPSMWLHRVRHDWSDLAALQSIVQLLWSCSGLTENFLSYSRTIKAVILFDECLQFLSIQFSNSLISDSLWPHELQHCRPHCQLQTPRVYSN